MQLMSGFTHSDIETSELMIFRWRVTRSAPQDAQVLGRGAEMSQAIVDGLPCDLSPLVPCFLAVKSWFF
jgi:hypothetical protein